MSAFAREYPDDWEAREIAITDGMIQGRINTIIFRDRIEEGEDG